MAWRFKMALRQMCKEDLSQEAIDEYKNMLAAHRLSTIKHNPMARYFIKPETIGDLTGGNDEND